MIEIVEMPLIEAAQDVIHANAVLMWFGSTSLAQEAAGGPNETGKQVCPLNSSCTKVYIPVKTQSLHEVIYNLKGCPLFKLLALLMLLQEP